MKQALIFSGYNVRAVIALCRLLKLGGRRAYIIARNQSDPIFKTEYADWVRFTRRNSILNISLFRKIRQQTKDESSEFVLMPSSEYLNRFALNHQSELASIGICIALVELELYKTVSDKASFRALCHQHNISVPETVSCSLKSIPFVAKQKCFEQGGTKQVKPYLITSPEIFENFLQNENPELYFFEQYISGESVYMMLFMSKSEIITFAQQNVLQQAYGGSMIAASKSDFQNSSVANEVVSLLRAKKFSGLIMIEFRLTEEHAYMIEANPRCWGPLQFSVDNYPELLWAFFRHCGIVPTTLSAPKARQSEFYFWSGGWQKDLSASRQIQYHPGSEILLSNPVPQLLKDDIFCREDTMPLFLAELNMECFT